jgi:hypothetical protein
MATSGVYTWTGAVWNLLYPGSFSGGGITYTIVDFAVQPYQFANDVYIIYNAVQAAPPQVNNVVYKNGLVYNATLPIAGTQFFGVTPIDAIHIDVSSQGDILLGDPGQIAYVRVGGSGLWIKPFPPTPIFNPPPSTFLDPTFYNENAGVSYQELASLGPFVAGYQPETSIAIPYNTTSTLNGGLGNIPFISGAFPMSPTIQPNLSVTDYRIKINLIDPLSGETTGIGAALANDGSNFFTFLRAGGNPQFALPSYTNSNSRIALGAGTDTAFLVTDGQCV